MLNSIGHFRLYSKTEQLEQLMGLIHPTAPASGSDSGSDYSGSSSNDTDSGEESSGESDAEAEE